MVRKVHKATIGRRRSRALRSVAVLPSLLTLGNLLCGFAAVFYASRANGVNMPWDWTQLQFAAALIFVGMLFDALDGRVARMTGQTSEMGGQLDSMADMVTFGVAPAFMVVQLVEIGTPFFGADRADTYLDRTVLIIAGLYVACCALRLARFNIETKEPEEADHMYFKGLPSPGAAGTVASLVLLHQNLLAQDSASTAARVTALAMVGITFLAAVGMVSQLRYIHVPNRYLKDRAPFGYVIKAVLILILLLIHPQAAFAIAFVIYALSAPTFRVLNLLGFGKYFRTEQASQPHPPSGEAGVNGRSGI